jgi:hypothetical protein
MVSTRVSGKALMFPSSYGSARPASDWRTCVHVRVVGRQQRLRLWPPEWKSTVACAQQGHEGG